ncbi:MAG: HutD family protein [Rhodoferax sp.]|nr:MAG: HutD family protein [Rhodoferax sp.]
MQRFAIADLPRMPWKNGGGSTREVVCQPPGAGMDRFDWRVSIASIVQSGPFSVFPGIDRSIALLDGDGVQLRAPGHFDHRLDTPAQPFAFAGDLAVDCTLLGGESTDFNVMTRRGVVSADVAVHHRTATLPSAMGGVLLVLEGGWQLSSLQETLDVPAGHGVWWAEPFEAWQLQPRTAQARLLAVAIRPAGQE